MSPIRALAKYPDGTTHVMECMITHGNGDTYACVVEKNMMTVDQPDVPLSYKDVAYRMITSRNSNFLCKYSINRTADGFRYEVRPTEYDAPEVKGSYLTLQDAMQSVFARWCESQRIQISGLL